MPVPWSILGVLTALHLGCQLFVGDSWITGATQVTLMPALAWVLTFELRRRERPTSRLVQLTLVALFFSWLGDAVPRFMSDDAGFLAMIGCFFLAQLTYIAAFLPFRRHAPAVRRPVLLAPFALAFVLLVLLCRDGAGALLGPVVVYGLALTTMAVLAGGPATPTGLGGVLFLVSDALIALGAFGGLELPGGNGIWVMATYVLGQTLIVLGVLHTTALVRRSPRPTPGGR